MAMCIFANCHNSKLPFSRLTFFSLPTDSRREIWIERSGNKSLQNISSKAKRFVCEVHFTEHNLRRQFNRTILHRNAIPNAADIGKNVAADIGNNFTAAERGILNFIYKTIYICWMLCFVWTDCEENAVDGESPSSPSSAVYLLDQEEYHFLYDDDAEGSTKILTPQVDERPSTTTETFVLLLPPTDVDKDNLSQKSNNDENQQLDDDDETASKDSLTQKSNNGEDELVFLHNGDDDDGPDSASSEVVKDMIAQINETISTSNSMTECGPTKKVVQNGKQPDDAFDRLFFEPEITQQNAPNKRFGESEEDKYFALSLVGPLQRLSPKKRVIAKINIMKYLAEMEFTENVTAAENILK